jgi:apolipoprotein N-acyltransferase
VRAVELDRYTLVASNVGISALVTPDGRELGRTDFFEPGYLDNQVRRKTTLTPAARWGPIVQGSLVVIAVAVLFAAMLHNGWFNHMSRLPSELSKNFGSARKKSDDDPLCDDDVADEDYPDEIFADPDLVEEQRPERGDI